LNLSKEAQLSTLEKVISVVSRETGKEVHENTFLDALGLDSLEFVCLMQAIQKEVADVPDAEFVKINTVGGIARACELIR